MCNSISVVTVLHCFDKRDVYLTYMYIYFYIHFVMLWWCNCIFIWNSINKFSTNQKKASLTNGSYVDLKRCPQSVSEFMSHNLKRTASFWFKSGSRSSQKWTLKTCWWHETEDDEHKMACGCLSSGKKNKKQHDKVLSSVPVDKHGQVPFRVPSRGDDTQ